MGKKSKRPFLRDTNSHFQLPTSLQNFARYSGLRVNDEKTEIFAIGRHRLVQDVFTHKIRSTVKILGVYFNYNTPVRLKANCESIFKSIKRTLNSWKGRGLTLIGKIQIVKSFIIPKFLSKVALIWVSEDHVKEINKLIYHFIWKGNDKIKRYALINDINDGGLKMLPIHWMICAQRVMVLKNYADEENHSSWKITLDYFLSGVGGKLILHCNFDTKKTSSLPSAFL